MVKLVTTHPSYEKMVASCLDIPGSEDQGLGSVGCNCNPAISHLYVGEITHLYPFTSTKTGILSAILGETNLLNPTTKSLILNFLGAHPGLQKVEIPCFFSASSSASRVKAVGKLNFFPPATVEPCCRSRGNFQRQLPGGKPPQKPIVFEWRV